MRMTVSGNAPRVVARRGWQPCCWQILAGEASVDALVRRRICGAFSGLEGTAGRAAASHATRRARRSVTLSAQRRGGVVYAANSGRSRRADASGNP